MAEDKVKRDKRTIEENNIYALNFDFDETPETKSGLAIDELEDDEEQDIYKFDALDDELEEEIYKLENLDDSELEEEVPKKKKVLSKIEEGIRSSKVTAKDSQKVKTQVAKAEKEALKAEKAAQKAQKASAKAQKTTKATRGRPRKNKIDDNLKQNPIKMHTEDNLTEIKLKQNEYKIELQKTEYNIYTDGNETSYIIVREPSLRMVAGGAYILLEKQGDDYSVTTNQDFKINYVIDNLERKNNVVNFKLTNLTQIEANEDGLIFEIDEEKIIENNLEDNRTLVISEEDGKVYLPYTKDDIRTEVSQNKGARIVDVIENKYVLPIDKYKNSMKARFREGYNLMYKREGKSRRSAIMLGIELMFESNLHPAIISACRNLEELDIYLDCLEDNELEKFSCFKIIYKSLPTLRKTSKIKEF